MSEIQISAFAQIRNRVNQHVYYGWVIVGAAVVVGFFTIGLSASSNGILLPHLADTLADGSRGSISIAFSISTFVGALISPWVGRYADNHSPRRVILVGAILIALSYIGIATSQTLWQFYAAKGVIFGLGIAMAGPVVRNLIVAHWFDRLRGRALGFAVLGASIAGVALPLILNELVDSFGWRATVFSFSIVVAAVLFPTVLVVMRDRPEDIDEVRDGRRHARNQDVDNKAAPTEQEKAWTWQELVQSRAFWATGLIFGPMVCVYIAIMVHLFGHVIASGFSTESAAFVLTIVALFALIGKPIVGFLADFLGARATIWISLLFQGAALVIFAVSGELWQFIFAAALHGLGYAALSPMRTFVLAENISVASLGASLGLLRWLEMPFAVSASPVAGFVYDATGSYSGAFLVFAGFIALAAIGPFFVQDKRAPNLRPQLQSLTMQVRKYLKG